MALMLFALPLAAQSGAGRVTSLSGRVSVERGRDLWALQANSVIQPGEVILSGPDGYAVLRLDDGSSFEIFPDSRVVFRANRGNWRDVLDVLLGRVKIHIEKLGGRPNPYRVNSATALIAVRGTVFEVVVAADATTTVAVVEGFVGVSHKLLPSQREILLASGESIVVRPNEPLRIEGISKARLAVRLMTIALEQALSTVRLGGGSSSPVPVPGGTTAPAGGGVDMGQAPPPPPQQGGGEGDSGPGSSAPPGGTP